MINLESTEFRAMKSIVRNVDDIYEEMSNNKSAFSFLGREEAIKFHLGNISENIYVLLGKKPLNSYIEKNKYLTYYGGTKC